MAGGFPSNEGDCELSKDFLVRERLIEQGREVGESTLGLCGS
jgi:hypothetical protein